MIYQNKHKGTKRFINPPPISVSIEYTGSHPNTTTSFKDKVRNRNLAVQIMLIHQIAAYSFKPPHTNLQSRNGLLLVKNPVISILSVRM